MADVKELNINNTTYNIKAKSIVNQNGGSLKYWTGTEAQYDALKPEHRYGWINYVVGRTIWTDKENPVIGDNVYIKNGIEEEPTEEYEIINVTSSGISIAIYENPIEGIFVRYSEKDVTGESHIDPNTLYNITDDTDVTLALLELLFPVGAVYFGTMATCPLQTLGVGTWQALPSDKVIQIAGTRGSVGTTINESLPNITGKVGNTTWNVNGSQDFAGSLYWDRTSLGNYGAYTQNVGSASVMLDASRSSSTYQDNAPVQQDAYLLRGWERIS